MDSRFRGNDGVGRERWFGAECRFPAECRLCGENVIPAEAGIHDKLMRHGGLHAREVPGRPGADRSPPPRGSRPRRGIRVARVRRAPGLRYRRRHGGIRAARGRPITATQGLEAETRYPGGPGPTRTGSPIPPPPRRYPGGPGPTVQVGGAHRLQERYPGGPGPTCRADGRHAPVHRGHPVPEPPAAIRARVRAPVRGGRGSRVRAAPGHPPRRPGTSRGARAGAPPRPR